MHKGRIRWKPAAAAGAVGQVDVGCRATAGLITSAHSVCMGSKPCCYGV